MALSKTFDEVLNGSWWHTQLPLTLQADINNKSKKAQSVQHTNKSTTPAPQKPVRHASQQGHPVRPHGSNATTTNMGWNPGPGANPMLWMHGYPSASLEAASEHCNVVEPMSQCSLKDWKTVG